MKINSFNIMAVMSKQARINRLENNFPKEFFYGLNYIPNFSIYDDIIDLEIDYKYYITEKILNYKRYKFSKNKAEKIFSLLSKKKTLISFNDFDSFNLGYYNKNFNLICGFHRAYETIKKFNYDKRFETSLKKIKKIFFFGPKDKEEVENLFPFIKDKSKLFKFGVDTKFWINDRKNLNPNFDICCVGSDTFRDYEILKHLNKKLNIKLVTKLKINDLPKNIDYREGWLLKSKLTDTDIKEIYKDSKIVVVPLYQTTQPSGYSVTLQSMSLGKAVIIANINGLWDRNLFKDGENIILYEPENPKDLNKKIELLINNKKLRTKIEKNAFETARKFFSLSRMKNSLLEILENE